MPSQFPIFNGTSWPIIRSPVQSTLVSTSVNGKQYTQQLYPFPKWNWKFSFGYLFDDYSNALGSGVTQFGFQALAGFFNGVGGRAQSWLYLDPFDHNATLNPLGYVNPGGAWTTVPDGVQRVFRVFKTQQGGPVEPVQYVLTISLFVNGVLQTFGTAYTLSQLPGTVTLVTAPPNGASLQWTGTFFYLCRFLQDKFEFPHEYYGIYTVKDLEFESVFA